MTPRKYFTIAVAAIALLAFSATARAQVTYEFKVPFSFVAGGKTLPAGEYRVFANDTQELLTLQAANPKQGGALLPVETRITSRNLAEPEIVFDKLNGQSYISEVLVPGEDGFLVLATKAKHTHQTVAGRRAKK